MSLTFSLVKADEPPPALTTEPPVDQATGYRKFKALLSNVTLVGHYTTTGIGKLKLNQERYEIRSVTKMQQGDYWLFQARIVPQDAKKPFPETSRPSVYILRLTAPTLHWPIL